MTRRKRPHCAVFDQADEKLFAVVRAADGTAEQHAGAVRAALKIYFGIRHGFPGGKPGQLVGARASRRRVEGGQILPDFADRNRAVARGGKETERLESAGVADDGAPDFADANPGGSDSAEAGDNWKTQGH